MENVKTILMVAGIAILLANIFVSYRVAVSDLLEPHQKIVQCAMIWLLPLLGAGLAYALMQEPKLKARGYSQDGSNSGIGDDGLGYGDHSGGGHDSH